MKLQYQRNFILYLFSLRHPRPALAGGIYTTNNIDKARRVTILLEIINGFK